jgi:hypothetical protein
VNDRMAVLLFFVVAAASLAGMLLAIAGNQT